mmetsp:Transcript_8419/g.37612  ORF Transcript_8419/g.37612 Transcript_8419/m.37612 type:complete len:129 (+) Transcript_8419:3013-3399(+)
MLVFPTPPLPPTRMYLSTKNICRGSQRAGSANDGRVLFHRAYFFARFSNRSLASESNICLEGTALRSRLFPGEAAAVLADGGVTNLDISKPAVPAAGPGIVDDLAELPALLPKEKTNDPSDNAKKAFP